MFKLRLFYIIALAAALTSGAIHANAQENEPQTSRQMGLDLARGRGAWFAHLITGDDNGDASSVLHHDAEVFANLNNSASFKEQSIPAWQAIGGSQDQHVSGRASAIAFDPTDKNTIYIGEPQAGVWKTTDHGGAWSYLSGSWTTNAMGGLAVDPNNHLTVYAGTGDIDPANGTNISGIGIMKTTDGGLNWTQIATTSQVGSYTYQMIVDPTNSAIVYQTGSSGIVQSIDSGKTWTVLLSQSGNALASMVIDPTNSQNLIAAFYIPSSDFGVPNGNIQRSTNRGKTWTRVGQSQLPSFGRGTLGIAASSQGVYVYIGMNTSSSSSSIGLSTDGGVNWSVPGTSYANWLGDQAWYANSLAVNPNEPNQVIVGGLDVYVSNDGGVSLQKISDWQAADNAGDFCHADIHRLEFGLDGIYVCSDGGVYYSLSPGTASWQHNMNAGLATIQFDGFDANRDCTEGFGGAQDNAVNEIKMSSSGAPSYFVGMAGGDGGYTYVSQEDNGQTIYSTHYSQQGDAGFIKSVDDGQYWPPNPVTDPQVNNDNLPFYPTYAVCESDAGTIAIAGSSTIWYSNSGGQGTFSPMKPGKGSASFYQAAVHICSADEQVVYAGSSSGKVWCSFDGSSMYSSKNNLGSVTGITSDPYDPTHAFAVAVLNNKPYFWETKNADSSWTSKAVDFPDVTPLCLAYDSSTRYIYVGTTSGVVASGDGGVHWITLSNGLPLLEMMSLHVRGHYLVVGTYGRGAFRLDLTNFGIAPQGVVQAVPTAGVTLENIYPNPVTAESTAKIGFSLPSTGQAHLAIYDQLGREVRVVENAVLPPGSYQRTADLSGLASGEYFYALTASGRTVSHSLVITR